jgi:hypothetical protein
MDTNINSNDTSVKQTTESPLLPAQTLNRCDSNKDIPIRGMKTVCIEPVLAFVWYTMQSSTIDSVKIATSGFFCLDAVIAAKNILWQVADNDIIGAKSGHRGTALRNEK